MATGGDRIHREFYPANTPAPVPRRYFEIVRSIRTHSAVEVPFVLEIGPERPPIAQFVAERLGIPASHYLALEASAISCDLLAGAGIRVQQVDVSSEDIPLPPQSTDVVIAAEVLEHLLNPERLLRSVRRVLRTNGVFVCTTPNIAAWFNRISLFAGFQPVFTENGGDWVYGRGPWAPRSRPVGHIHVATLGAWLEMLHLQGFRVVGAKGLSSEVVGARGRMAEALDSILARVPPLASDLLIIASPQEGGI